MDITNQTTTETSYGESTKKTDSTSTPAPSKRFRGVVCLTLWPEKKQSESQEPPEIKSPT